MARNLAGNYRGLNGTEYVRPVCSAPVLRHFTLKDALVLIKIGNFRRWNLFLLFLKQPAVVLHELAHHEEGIDGGDAVGNDARDELALSAVLALHKQLVPERVELLVVLLELGTQLVLAELQLLECAIGGGLFLYG